MRLRTSSVEGAGELARAASLGSAAAIQLIASSSRRPNEATFFASSAGVGPATCGVLAAGRAHPTSSVSSVTGPPAHEATLTVPRRW